MRPAMLMLIFSVVSNATLPKITSAAGTFFYDELGRIRILRGTNVVMKYFPYVPDTSGSQISQFSFNQMDVNLLQENGVTVIRLGVMWPGVEPQKGYFNQTYLGQISNIVQMCNDAGIYILLDFHQDLLSEKFCGEGVPSYVVENQTDFPVPLGARYPTDTNNTPSLSDCGKVSWGMYSLSHAVAGAYQRIYNNTNGNLDSLITYWKVVAKSLVGFSNILGYDMMNEPWAGDVFADGSLFDPVYANSQNLQPFYAAVGNGIRYVDPNAILFFEPVTLVQKDIGFSSVPGGALYENKSVFNFHYYDTVQTADLKTTIGFRIETAKNLSCGVFMSEFEMGWGTNGNNVLNALNTFKTLDSMLLSATGWEYKDFHPNNTYSTGTNNGLVDASTGLPRLDFAKATSRPYATTIPGYIRSMNFDDSSGIFVLRYNHNGQSGGAGTAEIVCNFALQYPSGYLIKAKSLSGSLTYTMSSNRIQIVPDSDTPGLGDGVAVVIYPTGSSEPQVDLPKANKTGLSQFAVSSGYVELQLQLWLFFWLVFICS